MYVNKEKREQEGEMKHKYRTTPFQVSFMSKCVKRGPSILFYSEGKQQ